MREQFMATDDSTRIAIRGTNTWTIKDWKDLDFTQESDWQKAIDIFENRIRGRFLDIIDLVSRKNGAGFAVMALDCLLIETLQQFREGVDETPRGKSKEYFRHLLTQTSFKNDFDGDLANLFYEQIRCGILHQAEVKKSSKIQTRNDVPLISKDESGGVIINRRKFHEMMEEVFQEYIDVLRKNDPLNQPLRDNFHKKMDAICRIDGKKEQ
jgi:hypothetical protein